MTTIDELASDFRSDTVTQPSPEMKAFMVDAPMGDDVFGEDPSARALQERVTALTGMEEALFFPSGSMANLAALMSHVEPGRILYAGAHSHVKLYELGGFARLAGLQLVEVEDHGGILNLDHLASVWSPDLYYMPQSGLVAVENTQNILGGLVYPEPEMARLRAFTRERGVPLHLDGARLFHAACAHDRPISDWTRHADSVMLSISKGLGAPVGSVLAGSSAFIGRALRHRKLLGGGMRQSGMLAAGGLYALDHHLPLLQRDHDRCRRVYEGIADLPWLEAVSPQTNILIFTLIKPVAMTFMHDMAEAGFRLLALGPDKVRLVFHLNLKDQACDALVQKIRSWEGAL